ncbi:MAG: hypothetical protein VB137_03750 [Burkholderia sp.]
MFPHPITTDIIETIGLDSMYADFQEVERISIEEAIRAGHRYEDDDNDEEQDDGRMSYEDFCEAMNDIADQNEPINVLAEMDKDTVDRAIADERAYSEAQDEWIAGWIDENADDPDDDDEHDSLHDFAQQTDEYEAFCDQARIDIAAEHGIEAEVLDHAIALMNDGDDALALLDQRRAELSAAHHHA